MGQPSEWIEQRQMEQVQQVQKAYSDARFKDNHVAFTEIKPDGIDQAYVWFRTFMPSWVMGVIFIVGIITLIPAFLRKFGVNIRGERDK